jgi:CheY-like chemotaxis protein/HPt (histidine-containing phosphotransfer) domain-containing protein
MAEQLRDGDGMTPFFVLNTSVPGGVPPTPGLLTPTGTRRLRVLIAEDDPTNRLVATRMLQRMGHIVEAVADGAEAVRLVQTTPCDLVLMDMVMPVMDGVAATRLIREAAAPLGNLPIVGLTGNIEPEHERACLEAGMNGFITKPVTTRRLTAAIAAVVQASLPPASPEAELRIPLLDEPFLRQLGEEIGRDGAVDAMEMFLEDAPDRLAAMRRALNAGANGALRREAHALAGAARNVGLVRLGEGAYGLQKALEAADEPDPGGIERLFQLLADSTARAMQWKLQQVTMQPGFRRADAEP